MSRASCDYEIIMNIAIVLLPLCYMCYIDTLQQGWWNSIAKILSRLYQQLTLLAKPAVR